LSARELEPNKKLFPDYLPFIFHGALVDAGSLWPPHSTTSYIYLIMSKSLGALVYIFEKYESNGEFVAYTLTRGRKLSS